MCGIAGCLGPPEHRDELDAKVAAMVRTLRHRGPDHEGAYVDPARGIGLGHRRLSVIDPSPAGHQPMVSACGRYVVTSNSEIYNFESLRRQLDTRGHCFRGRSDTEVLLAAIVEWGLPGALERFNGMFAFALWDAATNELHLARDRFGEKPLYYGWVGQSFLFGSELKALRAHPSFVGEVDRDALAVYLSTSCVPAPLTIYENTFKLPPGHVLTVRGSRERSEPQEFWSPRAVAERGATDRFQGSFEDAVEELDSLLGDVVTMRMKADVSVGAFLSGGIDSSSVVAAMQRSRTTPVRTFAIGFAHHALDEAAYAKAVAHHLGTDHTELYVTPKMALDVIPRIPELYDEPFADSSQIPTAMISRLARDQVTVALSGDGGDELFGGYPSFIGSTHVWRRMARIPRPLKRVVAPALRRMPAAATRRWTSRPRFWAEMLRLDGPESVHATLMSPQASRESVVIGASRPKLPVDTPYGRADLPSAMERMMYSKTFDYLPSDILAKVDRASMSVGLEVRAPLLDHRVFEFAARLPLDMKVRGTEGKRVLRAALHRHVPPNLVDRPKQGFSIPLADWLRADLREWATPLLDPSRLRDDGFFRPRPIIDRWNEHQAGSQDNAMILWNVLMFQAWLEQERS
jgi:asparagine synthase (glutamine-hydrolysing)